MIDTIAQLFESSNLPYGIIDKKGNIIWYNQVSLDLFPALPSITNIRAVIGDVGMSIFAQNSAKALNIPCCSNGYLNFLHIPQGWLIQFIDTYIAASRVPTQNLSENTIEITKYTRKPVTTILSEVSSLFYSELLDLAEYEAIQNSLKNINNSSYRLMRITHEIELYHKLVKNKYILNCKSILLTDLIYTIMQQIRYRYKHPVEFITTLKEVYVFGDSNLIEMAILEILINSLKAIPTEGGKISLNLTEREGTAYLTIQDNGWGIDPETMSQLFQPFMTPNLNYQTVGIGLGLTNAHLAISLLQGNIVVSSTSEKGTIVTLSLPTAECNTPNLHASSETGGRLSQINVILSDILDSPIP